MRSSSGEMPPLATTAAPARTPLRGWTHLGLGGQVGIKTGKLQGEGLNF